MTLIKDRIKQFIKNEVNPALEAHGGLVVVEDFDEDTGVLSLIMGGGCQGCASASNTLKIMITHAIKGEFPEVKEIEDSTDHAGGQNPYY